MSLGDRYTQSSYRKIFGDSLRMSVSSTRMSRATSGLRAMPPSHNSTVSMYRKVGRPSGSFTLMPAESLDLTQTSVVNNEFKVIRTNEKEQLQVGTSVCGGFGFGLSVYDFDDLSTFKEIVIIFDEFTQLPTGSFLSPNIKIMGNPCWFA